MKGGIMKTYYSLGEVARLLDVRPHRIVYLHTVAKFAEPERVFGNRAYRWCDVLKLAEHFGVTIEALEKGKRP
jgi:DNA-binding transcriptional MerR regulator